MCTNITDVDRIFMVCDAIKTGRKIPVVGRSVLLPSEGSSSTREMTSHVKRNEISYSGSRVATSGQTDTRSDLRNIICLLGTLGLLSTGTCRSQWLRGLRRGFAAACLLGLRVRIPPGGMDVSFLRVLCVVR
jgi:hypothetical protein